MIRQLRRKFVAITMAMVGIVLFGIFGVLLVSTMRQQQAETSAALYRAMDQSAANLPKPEIIRKDNAAGGFDLNGTHRGGSIMGNRVVFWVLADDDGDVTDGNVEEVDISEDTLSELVEEVLEHGHEAGTIDNPDLQYLVKYTPEGIKIVFADRTAELAAVRMMALRLAAIAVAALLLLFGISVFLARMAVRPVERAWEQQRQFVADASHELKTPLTVIMADASILQAHPGDTVAAQRKWLDGIQEEGTRMKKLIDDLLFLAKSDAARAPLVMTSVALSDLVMSSALSFESVAFEKGITLNTDVAPGLGVEGDAGQLKQLVAILVDNACKYAGGPKTVQVSLKAQGGNALLRVENTSTDIPPEQLAHVFERFYRTDASRVRTAGGYGLGLAIAQAISVQHGGSIRAESGGGMTAFHVSLPLPGGKKGTA